MRSALENLLTAVTFVYVLGAVANFLSVVFSLAVGHVWPNSLGPPWTVVVVIVSLFVAIRSARSIHGWVVGIGIGGAHRRLRVTSFALAAVCALACLPWRLEQSAIDCETAVGAGVARVTLDPFPDDRLSFLDSVDAGPVVHFAWPSAWLLTRPPFHARIRTQAETSSWAMYAGLNFGPCLLVSLIVTLLAWTADRRGGSDCSAVTVRRHRGVGTPWCRGAAVAMLVLAVGLAGTYAPIRLQYLAWPRPAWQAPGPGWRLDLDAGEVTYSWDDPNGPLGFYYSRPTRQPYPWYILQRKPWYFFSTNAPFPEYTAEIWPLVAAMMGGAVCLWRGPRMRRGFCFQCGYDLTGNASGTCPECGRSAEASA